MWATKKQLLRMIHRLSSPLLKVGMTAGDLESFDSSDVASLISSVVTTSLMFMNSKYSATQFL